LWREPQGKTTKKISWEGCILKCYFCEAKLGQSALPNAKRGAANEVCKTDQGSQFTGSAFTGLLASNGIAISMDGKGAWRDNVFVERLWRSVKYEEVYLRAYQSVGEARNSIGWYLDFYNARRPHQSLDDATPDRAYFNPPLFRSSSIAFSNALFLGRAS
jgi:putative transposase